MALSDIFNNLKTNYNSRDDNILEEIYIPCLENSNKFYRGAAYFRSSVLSLYHQSILDFCRRDPNSKISILTSIEVMPKDAENILLGYSLRDFELSLETLLNNEDSKEAAKFICALIAALDVHVVAILSS